MKIVSDILISKYNSVEHRMEYRSGSHLSYDNLKEEHLVTLDNGISTTVLMEIGKTPTMDDVVFSLASQIREVNLPQYGDHPMGGFHDD